MYRLLEKKAYESCYFRLTTYWYYVKSLSIKNCDVGRILVKLDFKLDY